MCWQQFYLAGQHKLTKVDTELFCIVRYIVIGLPKVL